MYFVTRKERNIIIKINYQTEILENYVNKRKSLEKVESKLVTFIKENKEEIKKMNTYLKKERSSVKDL